MEDRPRRTEASRGSVVVPLTYQQHSTAFTYETFIADNRVSLGFMETIGCGQAGFPNRSFGGDNRSYVTPVIAPYDTPNYRSMLFVNVNWDNPAPYDMIIDGGIGTTRLYDGTTLIESRTATFDDTTIDNTYKSGAYAQTHWAHSVGNPFCIAGAITYDVTVRFYRSGTIEIVGWRWPVPNHEAFGRWNIGSGDYWYSMYQASNSGFGCFTGSCGSETINVATTH